MPKMRKYSPRRASKRWLDGAPDYILDVFDNKGKTADRYTVMFTGHLTYHTVIENGVQQCKPGSDELSNTYVQYLGMSGAPSHPQGVSMWGELRAYEAAAYRYRAKHHRIKWSELPERIQQHVIARATE